MYSKLKVKEYILYNTNECWNKHYIYVGLREHNKVFRSKRKLTSEILLYLLSIAESKRYKYIEEYNIEETGDAFGTGNSLNTYCNTYDVKPVFKRPLILEI